MAWSAARAREALYNVATAMRAAALLIDGAAERVALVAEEPLESPRALEQLVIMLGRERVDRLVEGICRDD